MTVYVMLCLHRYGNVMAYSPATIVLNEPYNVTYTSDGTSPLDLIAWVMDIAGQNVTIGMPADPFCLHHFPPNPDMQLLSMPLPVIFQSTTSRIYECHLKTGNDILVGNVKVNSSPLLQVFHQTRKGC